MRWKQVDPDGNEVSKSKEVISESEEDYNPVTDSAKNLQELVAEKKAAKEAEETAAKEVEEKAAKEAEAKAAKEAEAKAAKEGRTKTTIKPGK